MVEIRVQALLLRRDVGPKNDKVDLRWMNMKSIVAPCAVCQPSPSQFFIAFDLSFVGVVLNRFALVCCLRGIATITITITKE